jgi:ferredoxin-NADP reductase/ferredoxin
MGAAMGEMMKQMGTPPRKELYPSLMALPDEVTPEERAGIEQLAHERMKAGTSLISSSLEKLSNSTSDEDYEGMQQAAAQMREGLAEFEAGIAARRVLSEGREPRNLALGWFKQEMNLASPIRPEDHGIRPIHIFTMLLLIAFALAMLAMYFFKMRRAEALFGRIGPDAKPPPGTPPPPAGKPAPVEPASPAKPAGGAPPAAATSSSAQSVGGTPPAVSTSPGGSPAVPVPDANATDTKRVAGRADELWRARGRPIGSPKIDWLQAEEELAKTTDKTALSAANDAPPGSAASPAAVPRTANWRGQLRVGSIVAETPNVKTFRLVPSSNDSFLPFTFVPGQFLNVAFWIGGARMNRSYSISSSPMRREYVELTVRREPRGAVSRHIDDLLKVGDQIEAGGPVGKFTFDGTEASSVVLISGGVGITPMMSITRYLTEHSWPGDIFFVYTCRTPGDFIFADEITALQRLNPKFHVEVTISSTEGKDWKGRRGRISKDWLTETVPDLASRRIHLCGPPLMMDSVKAILTELGVPPNGVKTEAFGAVKPTPAPAGTSAKTSAPATGPLVTFSKSNKSSKIRLDLPSGDSPPKQSILELSEELGIGIEFSCRVGTCGVCKVKMTSGEVEMEVQDALDEDDKKGNYILGCQAKPKGDVAVVA